MFLYYIRKIYKENRMLYKCQKASFSFETIFCFFANENDKREKKQRFYQRERKKEAKRRFSTN
jgi:hypothetical protein